MDNLEYLKPSKRNRQKRRDKRLSEELIECRRWGGGDKSKKYREKSAKRKLERQIMRDTVPQQESYKAKRCYTSQDDNLEPLIRFLQTHTGQKWDEVYAKLSKQLDKRSATGLHVFEHLWDFVTVNVKNENGKLVFYNQDGDLEGRYYSSRWNQFYVDPNTNILHNKFIKKQKGPFPKKARWKKAKQKAKIKRKLGIITKSNNVYAYPQVKTYQQKLEVGKFYDLKHDGNHSRGCFEGYDAAKNQIKFKIIKTDKLTGLNALNYFLGERKRYGYWTYNYSTKKLQIFNVGTLHFELMWDKKRQIHINRSRHKKITRN